MNVSRFYVTGVTHPLVDGQPRNVTLAAIVTTEHVTAVNKNVSVKEHGKRKVTTIQEDTVNLGTKVTIAFGLAVVSPVDLLAQAQAQKDLTAAKADLAAPINGVDQETANKLLKAKKALVEELATKANIVSPARGEVIACGKASKEKSRLGLVTVDGSFFTKHMVKTLLAEKLKHVQTDPNRFIRIAPPKTEAVVKSMDGKEVNEAVPA